MNGQRWTRSFELFHEALEQPPHTQAAWLASACAGDSALLADVSALLAAHAATDHPLDRSPQASPAMAEIAGGDRIGVWRVVRLLERGGMGQVYEVQRDDGAYEQRAALKLLGPALAHPALVDVFLRERRLLARLEHPQIARLIDGGYTATQLPYLVMEFVEGRPLDQWFAQQALSWRGRVALLARVCDVVDFAHRQLVVHRDLKPGNVLVRADGVPVLLDFGIAGSIDIDDAAVSSDAVRPLTPRYASPEQLDGADAGVAADVFALGIILHEALCGATPWLLDDVALDRRAAAMRAQPPARTSLAARRAGRAVIARDIDWICRRALQPDPRHRYGSAHALAEDLRAVLAHRPVAARPDSSAYRAARLVRRRWPWLAAAALFCVMIGGFFWRLSTESARTRQALAQTRVERDRAEQVAGFISGLFRIADTTHAGGRTVSAREVLDRGRDELARSEALPGASRIALLNSLAMVYANMGQYPAAVQLLQQARGLLHPGIPATLEAETLDNLGTVLELSGDSRGARIVLEQALAQRRASDPPDPLAVAQVALHLASALQSLGDREQAGALFQEAHRTHARVLPRDDPRRADSALLYGGWFWLSGRLEDAQPYYVEALAVRSAQRPVDAPQLARALDANGALGAAMGRHADAIVMYRRALSLRRAALGNQHRFTADTLSNLGAALFDNGDAAGAEPLLREALDIYTRVLPSASPVAAKALNNLGLVRNALGDRREARQLMERALAINRQAYGEQHARVAGNLNNLALVAESADDLHGAEDALVQSIAIIESVQGADHPALAFPLSNLGRVLAWRGEHARARALFERALAIRRRQLPGSHPALVETLAWFGLSRCLDHDADAGRVLLDEATTIRARVAGAGLSQQDLRAMVELCASNGGPAPSTPLSPSERAHWIAARGSGDLLAGRYVALVTDAVRR